MEKKARGKKGRKVGSKKTKAKRTKKIDNPLFKPTSKAAEPVVTAAPPPEVKIAPRRKEERPKGGASPQEEDASIFEIVSDLGRELDAGFSMRVAQEEEMAGLKERLEAAVERVAALDGEGNELKKMLVSQEALSAQLEFLENERLEAGERIASLERGTKEKSAGMKELGNKVKALTKGIDARDTRIEQIEQELDSTNATVQSFQSQISLLEDEKEDMSDRMAAAASEAEKAIADRDRSQAEMQRAKDSLNEIRLMLAEARAKARKRHYQRAPKGR